MPVGYIGQESLYSSTELIGDPKDWRNSGVMLDVGCGIGTFALYICERFSNLCAVGIDKDPDAIGGATEAAKTLGLDARVRFELRDMDELVIDRNYDAIISIDAIQHARLPICMISTLLGSWSRHGPFRVSAWCFSETQSGRALACRWGCDNALPREAYEQAQFSNKWPVETVDTTSVFEIRSRHSLESLLEIEAPFRRVFGDRVFEERLSLEQDTVLAIQAGIIGQLHVTSKS